MVWAVSAALALAMASSRAEDIDLYVSASTAASAPNVLMVIDNSSNWSANDQAWSKETVKRKCGSDADCLRYVEQIFGSDATLTQGQVQAAALKLVLDELVCGPSSLGLKVKLGFMFLNEEGSFDINGTQADKSFISGYIRHRVTLLDSAQCDKVRTDLTAIRADINNPLFKGPSSTSYGHALFEAFKYYGGWTNPAGASSGTAGAPTGPSGFGPQRNSVKTGREDPLAFTDAGKSTYKSPIEDTCGKSYIIFVGNTYPNQEPRTDQNKNPPTNDYLGRLDGTKAQIYSVPNKADIRFADEWTRFLWNTDVNEVPGQQRIRTYTIDVFNPDAGKPDNATRAKQAALLRSMASAGEPSFKDGYYGIGGDLKALIGAFRDLLTQVAAENSVFASASLPVSANAQGLYLNQVFIGMFRPDAGGHQRWTGNLKQYQFKQIPSVTTDGQTVNDLTLVDASGNPALDETTTGFLRQCARSFWTTDSGDYWNFVPGSDSSLCTPIVTSLWSDLPDGPIVERGGAAQRLRVAGHDSRNLRTCITDCGPGAATIPFDKDRVPPALSDELVKWVRGENLGDGFLTDQGVASTATYPGLPISATTRPTIHGGVIHSRPLVVNYGTTTDDVVVFYGADDGVLRAVDGNTTGSTAGQELWGFIASEHYSKFVRLRSNSPKISYPGFAYTPAPRPKDYFFDGSIGGYQERTASTNKVWLYASMRRGGRMVYAFNASQKPSRTSNPTLLWRFGCASDTECATAAAGETQIGQTWSTPQAIRVRIGDQAVPLVTFGAGYDACEDQEATTDPCAAGSKGRGLFVLDAELGAASSNYRHFLPSDLSGVGRFVADVTALDINLDGYIDVLYSADTRGNLWRINTSNPSDGYKGYASVADWPMILVARLSDWTTSEQSNRRKFQYGASAVHLKDGQVIVQLGSGDREKPLQGSEAANVVNRFYGIRDNVTRTAQSDVTPVTHSGTGLAGLANVTGQDPVEPETTVGSGGWYFNLVTTSAPYEQVVTTPLTIGGVTYFSTYQANGTPKEGACYNLGTARAYRVNFQTGTKLPDAPLATEFLRGGFAPSPVAGIALVDGKKVPFIIGGQGASQVGVDKPVLNPKKKRTPVYRYQRIDR